MKNKYLLNTLLALVLLAALAAMMVTRVYLPAAVLPPINIPNMVLVSLIALLLDHWLNPNAERCYICIPVFSAISFGVLPLMAGFACRHDFWLYGVVGGVVFTVTTWMFTSMTERLLTGPKARAAVLMGAVGIFLAAQCFAGIIL